MRKRLIIIILAIVSLCAPTTVLAVGTLAGTDITNQAQVNATINSLPATAVSPLVTITVDEIINLTLTWLDAANVPVQPDETEQMLTFLLTNTGNGNEQFLLFADNSETTDQFNPFNEQVYLDNDGDGIYQEGVDLLYNPATNVPNLNADEDITIFVFNDIPGGVDDADTGISRLTVESETGTGNSGDVFPSAIPGGTTSILGSSGGNASADGIYEVDLTGPTLTKSYQLTDPDGGNEPVTGATITYLILIEIPALETATGMVITDVIPTYTTYIPESMRLINGTTVTVLTDANDSDEGEFRENPPASGNYEIRYSLGDLTDTTRTVTFQVTID